MITRKSCRASSSSSSFLSSSPPPSCRFVVFLHGCVWWWSLSPYGVAHGVLSQSSSQFHQNTRYSSFVGTSIALRRTLSSCCYGQTFSLDSSIAATTTSITTTTLTASFLTTNSRRRWPGGSIPSSSLTSSSSSQRQFSSSSSSSSISLWFSNRRYHNEAEDGAAPFSHHPDSGMNLVPTSGVVVYSSSSSALFAMPLGGRGTASSSSSSSTGFRMSGHSTSKLPTLEAIRNSHHNRTAAANNGGGVGLGGVARGWRRFWTLWGPRSSRTATRASVLESAGSTTTTTSTTSQNVMGLVTTSDHSISVVPSVMGSSSTNTTTSSSVHLQLNKNDKDPKPDESVEKEPHALDKNYTMVKVHSYVDPQTGQTWKAINTPKQKFVAFLKYNEVIPTSHSGKRQGLQSPVVTSPPPAIVTKEYRFSNHHHHHNNNDKTANGSTALSLSTSQQKQRQDEEEKLRMEWRKLWKQRRLLTDRTEFLAVYPSDNAQQQQQQKANQNLISSNIHNANSNNKRGGFADLLHLYCERLVAVLEDELCDNSHHQQAPPSSSGTRSGGPDAHLVGVGPPFQTAAKQQQQPPPLPANSLVRWLQEHYGADQTRQLLAVQLRRLPEEQQLAHFKHFLEWFRSYFPYFYDRCSACGASIKDEQSACSPPPPASLELEEDNDENDLAEDDVDINNKNSNNQDEAEQPQGPQQQTFVGYIYPGEKELQGKASRTELYQCHKCHEFTRFPRFNSAWHVMQSRRGRCGEYSMLLFRFLRALGHETRWVVDWADHVWAEVYLTPTTTKSTTAFAAAKTNGASPTQANRGPRWIHLDPCEAAVDENLIYQGWGKKQTYIVAFYAPPPNSFKQKSLLLSTSSLSPHLFPLIQDVTHTYTSDAQSVIQQRRDESPEQVQAAMTRATEQLQTHTNLFGATTGGNNRST